MQQKGFTLIELLIVIAIIAVLSVVVVLTLNPAELLRQARDSTRISDMANFNSAMNIYLADGLTFGSSGCFSAVASGGAVCGDIGFVGIANSSTILVAVDADRAIDGSGWIPVDFRSVSAGTPFGILPIDPTNTVSPPLFYALAIESSSTYKFNTRMESTKYASGTAAVGDRDGGTDPALFEVGNKMSL